MCLLTVLYSVRSTKIHNEVYFFFLFGGLFLIAVQTEHGDGKEFWE